MGTGQYDYNIYQTLLRLEEILNSMFEFFEPWNEFFSKISSGVTSLVSSVSGQNGTFYPLIVSCLVFLIIISIIKWLVKL